MGSLVSSLTGGKVDGQDIIDPGGALVSELTGSDIARDVADPLDLHGRRSEEANARVQDILRQSAESGIALNEAQLAQIEALTAPFRDAATDTALPTLSNLALGGEVDYKPSELLTRQLASGREGTLESRSAGPGIKSSGTFENLADLASTLSAQDVGRFEQGNIDLLNTGLRAEDVLRQTGTSVGGNVGGIFGNLGEGINASQRNLAQTQINSANTLGSGIASLSRLTELRN